MRNHRKIQMYKIDKQEYFICVCDTRNYIRLESQEDEHFRNMQLPLVPPSYIVSSFFFYCFLLYV
jgi:hypothetical protein